MTKVSCTKIKCYYNRLFKCGAQVINVVKKGLSDTPTCETFDNKEG